MSNPVEFKLTPNAPWKDWEFMAPTNATLAILKREAEASHKKAIKQYLWAKKKGIKKPFPIPHCLFYGEHVYAFRWNKSRVWNVEQGEVANATA